MDDEMFSVLTEGLAQEGPKAAELLAPPVAPPVPAEAAVASSAATITIDRRTLRIVAGVAIGIVALLLAYMILRPKKAITIVAEKAQYNALFDAPFSSLPGPLMKMPADHLRAAGRGVEAPTSYDGATTYGSASAAHDDLAPALPVLAQADDIVPVTGQIPIWGDETVTEKAEARIDEQSMDIKRLIAEREAASAAIEKEMAENLKSQKPT